MNALIAYTINENNFILSPERVLYWEKHKTLIVADLHIGKTGHFRKAGIPVPQHVYKEDLQRLFTQVLFFKAEQLIIAGDLSHSKGNRELELFKKWRNDFRSLKIFLVNGNHDILEDAWYRELNIKRKNKLVVDGFSFYHDPGEIHLNGNHAAYSFCGHLHPSVSIRGRGKQELNFPCFYFTHDYAVLPAFSRFSGMARVNPAEGEHVFAIMENGLIQMQ
jgi:DNA ligase-associated metallophosphoesterase